MIKWLIKYSRGYVKTEKQARQILLAFSIIILIVDLLLIAKAFNIERYFAKDITIKTNIPEKNKIHHRHPHVTPPTDSKIVEITSDGFIPAVVTIKQGKKVTWINRDTNEHWPAANEHPTHINYPANYSKTGSYFGSQACLGPLKAKPGAFDPCGPITFEGMWTFTFNQKGTWKYHDHLNPMFTGTVVVESTER